MFSPVQVAAWGGYTFVLNLIGLHAAVTAVRTIDLGYDGTLSFADPTGLHRAYSIFYIIGTRPLVPSCASSSCLKLQLCLFVYPGTAGAVQFPVVGWAPLRSLEQLAPMAIFFGIQLLQVFHMWRQSRPKATTAQQLGFLAKLIAGALLAAVFVIWGASTAGYLGPLSARVRGLFVRHTKTGNPLVDSVAEHQSTRPSMSVLFYDIDSVA